MGSRLKYWIFFSLSFPKESFLLKYLLQYHGSLIVIKKFHQMKIILSQFLRRIPMESSGRNLCSCKKKKNFWGNISSQKTHSGEFIKRFSFQICHLERRMQKPLDSFFFTFGHWCTQTHCDIYQISFPYWSCHCDKSCYTAKRPIQANLKCELKRN